ncbi:HPF/RaiA family ribosome-associated protein [Noviherbaspirillum sedimenti]|uniref:HPF/RaiA family ribosome-associated protein n=1 Tax=Noviherbaspirillum sedimenti TaxID=2320865 RepID=A0A3A3G5B7_9BURK|nr:HPF/RaiA family ribosome-associated protein [Noviherbaspirillum sedimenti]RJG01692.1 HPF/RaiA family ribosome-associated protein [Noviherbaspirillum sedimenti]
MQVHMVSPQFSLTPSLREYLEQRLRAAFAPLGGKIIEIAVRLRDLNGPRGGCDMQCQVSVTMAGKPAVIIREVQENMYNAIDLAVKRAAYRVSRIASRQRPAGRQVVRITEPDA